MSAEYRPLIVRGLVILHVVSFIVAVFADLVLSDKLVEKLEHLVLQSYSVPDWAIINLEFLAFLVIVCTIAGATATWKRSPIAKWILTAWWLFAFYSALVIGPSVQSSLSQIAVALLFGTGGAMLLVSFEFKSYVLESTEA